jgi:hypothetical protein
MFPSTTAALRLSPRSFARFIGEHRNAAEKSSWVMPNSSRASVHASLLPNASRGANGEPSASSRANLTLYGHTDWDVWRYNRVEIRLGTGARTLAKELRK